MARRGRRRENNYYDIQLLNDLHNYFPDLLYNSDRFLSMRDVLSYIREVARRRYNVFEQAQEEYENTYYPVRGQAQTQAQRQVEPQEVRLGGAAGRLQAQARQQSQQQQQQQQRPRFQARGHFQHRAPRPAVERRTDHTRTTHVRPINYMQTFNRFPTTNTPLTTLTPLFDFNTFGLTTFPMTTAAPNPTMTETTQADIDGATALLTLLGLATTAPTTPLLPPNLLTPVIVRPSHDIIQQATTLETIQEPLPTGICVICQEEYAVGNAVRRIRHCQHFFHNDCIMQHFDSSVRCPTCRHDIRDSVEADHQ